METSQRHSGCLEMGPVQSQFDKRHWCVLHIHQQRDVSEVNVEYNHLMTWSLSGLFLQSETHSVYADTTNNLQASVDR